MPDARFEPLDAPVGAPFGTDDFEGQKASDDQFVRRLLQPAHWRVLDFPETAWWGHLPFMFSVVDLMRPRRFVELGTHFGASFFAAAQAAKRLDFPMEAIAIDSWEGEYHTGGYDESVYESVVRVIDDRGYENVTLLRMLFDEGAAEFAESSIDLLHIDGLHTYDAVKHDYETWIDAVVPGGLVMFHDIRVHQKDFGVWRLWEEIKDDGLSFAFDHSHGLGLLQKPGDAYPQVRRLLEILRANADIAASLQLSLETLSELGHLASKLPPTQAAHSDQKARSIAKDERIRVLEARLADATRSSDSATASIRSLSAEIGKLEAANAQLDQANALATSQLEDHAAELRSTQKSLSEKVRSTDIEREDHRRRAGQLRTRVERLTNRLERSRLETRLARQSLGVAAARERAETDFVKSVSTAEPLGGSRLTRAFNRAAGRAPRPLTAAELASRIETFRRGQLLEDLANSGLFDEAYYLASYPDVADFDGSPLEHFVDHGRREGRKPNEFFDPAEYLGLNQDLAAQNVIAIDHFMRRGGTELRRIGDHFDMPGYAVANSDELGGGQNPLAHYLLEGRDRGLSPTPTEEEPEADVMRRRKRVDRRADRQSTEHLLEVFRKNRQAIDDTRVSIVMPSYNRADIIERAILSVEAQTHQNWELLIVDDGSSDGTLELLERYHRDPRIQVTANNHGGVSVARNTALDLASGDFVAYLDTDNEWTPEYLRLMIANFLETGSDCAYAAMVSVDSTGTVTSYLSSEFDWDACYNANYVDMNVFMHRRETSDDALRFSQRLRRMVDWDFILRMTKDTQVDHLPFVGCRYDDGEELAGRISKFEPVIYRSMIQHRNDPTRDVPPTFEELADELVLDVAIRISAPWAKRHVWGDTHYAVGLQDAIEQLGHNARIVYHDDGPKFSSGPPDEVNLVLRGLTPHAPIPGNINILWVISHPELVTFEELAGYNLVYFASASHAEMASHVPGPDPRILLQATGFEPPDEPANTSDVVFVGNSRRVDRPIVRWASESEVDLAVYGGDWDSIDLGDGWKGKSYPNEMLPQLYAGATYVLNDHWDSMREFGYVSNRVFDVLASGGEVISDELPSITRLFGDTVAQVSNAEELAAIVNAGARFTDDDRMAHATSVHDHHSFEVRARQLVNDIFMYLRFDTPLPIDEQDDTERRVVRRRATSVSDKPARVGALFMPTALGYQSSAYIRAILPLTSESVYGDTDLSVTSDPDELDLANLDAVLVQRTALADLSAAERLVEQARDAGVRLLVDVDDHFGEIRPGTDQYELYAPRVPALDHLVSNADLVLVSTAELAHSYGIGHDSRMRVVPNSLDPRLWRRYERPDQIPERRPGPVRFVYMGTATHDEDFELIVPALDDLAGEREIELSIIGAVRNPPDRSWIHRIDPPRGAGLYPRFVQWLMQQERFDIGLAPLVESKFNAAKSDIKFLDYCAMGAIPVVSNVEAYEGDSHLEGLAYHARSSVSAWTKVLHFAVDELFTDDRRSLRRDFLFSERSAGSTGLALREHLLSD
ncbi:MAG: glycosyltransferase [Acidimicrobiales bacterium]|nr:glycosyltransferase [Acidimicrobiales bacterium]RZV44990.1 MAG: glycosyltransferase [Acidimicrobiales bacterium]